MTEPTARARRGPRKPEGEIRRAPIWGWGTEADAALVCRAAARRQMSISRFVRETMLRESAAVLAMQYSRDSGMKVP